MVRVDSAKHIHEAMATIPGLHKRGKSLELPMTKRLAFRKCRNLTKRLPALLCMGLVVFLLCSAVFKPRDGNGAVETDQLNFGGPDDSTKIPRADPRGGERGRRRAMPLKLASSIGNELVHELDDLGRPMLGQSIGQVRQVFAGQDLAALLIADHPHAQPLLILASKARSNSESTVEIRRIKTSPPMSCSLIR